MQISRDDLLAGNLVCDRLRTREEYELEMQLVKENPNVAHFQTESGLKEDCALHVRVLPYY